MKRKASKKVKIKEKKADKKVKIKAKHIKKISKVTQAEDLFLLTTEFKEEDNKKLLHLIKKNKKKIPKIIKEDKDSKDIRGNIISALIEEIENKYSELKDKCSELRKKGKDTLLAELRIMSLQYKLKLFRATKDKKDYLKIKKIIDDIGIELNH